MAWHHEGVSSNDSNPGFTFPRLYRQWINHDLKYHEDIGSIRPWFYEGLKPEDQPRVWRFIEENYLLKYDEFMAVRFDWSSSGLWEMPFPGSRRDVGNICLEGLGMPERAKRLLREWHDPLDARPYDEDEEDFDYEASDARGLAAAKEVKLFLGERAYLEFFTPSRRSSLPEEVEKRSSGYLSSYWSSPKAGSSTRSRRPYSHSLCRGSLSSLVNPGELRRAARGLRRADIGTRRAAPANRAVRACPDGLP